MSSWIRGKPANGRRQINIRYDCDEAEFIDIERMLAKATYKNVNKVMRHALLVGCKVMLSQLDGGGQADEGSSQSSAKASRSTSKTAQGMFAQFGESNHKG
jgi:hypothetical protein